MILGVLGTERGGGTSAEAGDQLNDGNDPGGGILTVSAGGAEAGSRGDCEAFEKGGSESAGAERAEAIRSCGSGDAPVSDRSVLSGCFQ